MLNSEFTYARSDIGRKALIADLQADIDAGAKKLTGDSYNSLLKLVNENWIGNDKTKFVKTLQESVKDLQAKFKSYKNEIANILDSEAASFKTMQQANADSINKINIG